MMIRSLNLRRISHPPVNDDYGEKFSGNTVAPRLVNLSRRRLQNWSIASLSTNSSKSLSFGPSFASSTTYTSSVGSPPLSHGNLTHRHILVLNFIACSAAITATWLFCSAISTLLALKRAAESLEKLLDVTREELPDTMAAVRLSGMEISDLTMELSNLGQGITQGVKSSTRAVRLAEERLRQLPNMNPSATMQVVVQTKPELTGPVVAKTARRIRESIVKSRAFLPLFFSITQFSKVAIKHLKKSRATSKS